jgi:hypothetical protein
MDQSVGAFHRINAAADHVPREWPDFQRIAEAVAVGQWRIPIVLRKFLCGEEGQAGYQRQGCDRNPTADAIRHIRASFRDLNTNDNYRHSEWLNCRCELFEPSHQPLPATEDVGYRQ